MARTVVAIYDDFTTANAAVRDLVDHGFSRENISLIANNTRGEFSDTVPASAAPVGENAADETGAGAGVGASIGAALGGIGGLLVGLGALIIPGIGPIIAAGPLAVALTTLTGAGVGAVAGGVTGGLLGALIGLGIPEQEAEYYAEGVRRGGVLVTVQADEASTEQILAVLNQHHPMDIKDRASQWREEGWERYDPNAPALNGVDATIPTRNTTLRENIGMAREFDENNAYYRNHYTTYLASSGYDYNYYVPAYRYGFGLGGDPMYQGSNWDAMEPNVRSDWEREHPGTWERFKTAIRHSWEDVTGGPNDPSDYR